MGALGRARASFVPRRTGGYGLGKHIYLVEIETPRMPAGQLQYIAVQESLASVCLDVGDLSAVKMNRINTLDIN